MINYLEYILVLEKFGKTPEVDFFVYDKIEEPHGLVQVIIK